MVSARVPTCVSMQEVRQEGEANVVNFPGNKPNSWRKLSDGIEEEFKLRYVLKTPCSNNHQEIWQSAPGLLVWLQCGMQVPPTLVRRWWFCTGRQAWFCQRSFLKRLCPNKKGGCRVTLWISYRDARGTMVPSAPGRAPRAAPAWCRWSVSPGSHQPRGGPCQAIVMQNVSLIDSSELRMAVWSYSCAGLFTTNTGVKAAAKKQ